MQKIYDVAIIGAGAVGTAIARELSRCKLKIALVEAKSDVGMGATKANTAIWHTGFDAKTGTLEAQLLRRSYALMEAFAPEAGIPTKRLGGLLVAWTEDQFQICPIYCSAPIKTASPMCASSPPRRCIGWSRD